MAELATAAASKAAERVTETMCEFGCRHMNYVFKYQSYMKKLKEQAEDFKSRRKDVEVQAKLAERQGEEIYDEVTKWLKSVEAFMERVAKLVDDEDKAKKCCFKGLCPVLIKRYRLSKEAEEVMEEGAKVLEKGKFSRISNPPLQRSTESIFVGKEYEHFDSRESNFQEIMDALKDSTVNMIGVHGMGGVGKTTLIKKVAWKAKEDKLFDEVVIAEVTQTPDVKKIQADIAGQLGMVFRDQESLFGRADQLHHRLKKSKRILVIVDNIWKKLDLKDVGIPLSYDNKGSITEHRKESNDEPERCTILLTARMLAVLNQMKTQKNISVEPLATNDARSLFGKIVGDLSEKHGIAAEIVEKCAGSPLAITTIANALKGKSDYVWKDALHQLKSYNHRCVPEMDNTLYSTIELSYKLLNSEEAKSLLLLCALYNDAHVSHFFSRSMGLGLFENVYSINDGSNRINSLIDYLRDSCLLLRGNDNEIVKMHDVIHTVVVSIAKEKCMFDIRDVKGIKDVLMERMYKDSIAISLSYTDTHELPERVEFPKLKLFGYYTVKDLCLQIPDHFFEGMKELKALELEGVHLLPPPPSFVSLTNLKGLCFCKCSLGDITMMGELRKLETLEFLSCDFEQLPERFKQLTGLKLLQLSDCPKLKVIPSNVIASLSQLEELYINNSFDRWEVEGQNNASLAELKALPQLNTLWIHIPNVQMIQQDFIPANLEKYEVHIGDVWDWSYAYETSRTLKLKFNGIPHIRHGIEILMEKAKYLYLDQLDGVKDMPWELDREGFPELKHLSVQNSSEILYIVNSMEYTHPNDAFPILESMFLINLSDMEKICCGLDNAKSFSQLRIIKVADCDKLRYLFSSSMAKNILLLEEINVTNCKTLEEIFGGESEDHADENRKVCKIEFKQLHSVVLQVLPQFICFGLEVVLPRLENLKLSSIKIENIWVNLLQPTPSYIQCLKSLTVEECNGLKFLFSSSMVKSFVQLQKLVICNCKSMEAVIFESRELEGANKIIQMNFPKLFYLKLQGLPKLTRFGIGNLVQFPSLNELHVESCSSLKTFFPNSSSVDVSLENSLSTNIEPLFDDKADLPGLEKLILLHLDNLQLIWHNQLRGDSFCKLKEVRFEFCKKLMTIVPSDGPQGLITFQNLETLTAKNCWYIKSLFPVSIATSLLQLKKLELFSCGLEEIVAEQEVDGTPKFLFPQLTRLKLDNLPKLKHFYMGSYTVKWPKLKELLVYKCRKIKVYALDGQSQPALFSFEKVIPNLEILGLRADNLTSSCLNRIPARSFGKLKILGLDSFDDYSVGFQFGLLQKLHNLEELGLYDCTFRELLPYEGYAGKQSSQMETFLQNLQTLRIYRCHCLTYLMSSSVICFKRIKNLEVYGCKGLENILSFSTATTLVHLTTISVIQCESMTKVIETAVDTTEEEIVFSQLKMLKLHCLKSLTCFYYTNYTFRFPCLEQVIVSQCPNMKTFSQGGGLSTPKLKKVQLTETINAESFWKDDLNSTIQHMFTNMVAFPRLEEMILLHLGKLQLIWHNQLLGDSFCKLKEVRVEFCENLMTMVPSNSTQGLLTFQNLETLTVKNCWNLKSLFPVSMAASLLQLKKLELFSCGLEIIVAKQKVNGTPKFLFPQLTRLRLDNLPELKHFYMGSYTAEWPMLKELLVYKCWKIKVYALDGESQPALFSFEKVIPNLEILGLKAYNLTSSCLDRIPTRGFGKLKILGLQSFDDYSIGFQFGLLQKLHNLEELGLYYCTFQELLPYEGCTSKQNSQIETFLQNLQTLRIWNCHHLRYLMPSSHIWFKNIKHLEVYSCNGLVKILACSVVRTLVQIKTIKIKKCKLVTEVITTEYEIETTEEEIVFNQLETLEFHCLKSLTCFCSANYAFRFPCLEQVIVSQCPNFKIFSPGGLSTPKLKKVELTKNIDAEHIWKGDLNSTIQHMCEGVS
ncbi:uncharacterized protein LOC123200443 isoform X4 [Mangifera indica]|uniref:uncharacterized protein LOC123200443 isoform X4 n=1 Tax=Mangifera indica TaxID=29780 RepID=UPI001CF93602|nr:uncharacterized protein LOC123200443 isoform X4 [Mangifera indica]